MTYLNRFSVFAAVGVTSFLAGRLYEETQRTKGYFTINSVLAKAAPNIVDENLPIPITEVKTSLPAITGVSTNKPARIGEIMKYGFPSLENVRSFDDFVLSYDNRNRVPNWVIEHLTPESVKYNDSVDRSKCEFHEDTSIHPFFRSQNSDYYKSGFDRGHLAAAGNHKLRQEWCAQTFVLSNMAPQVGRGFNRDTWNRLEKYTRKLTHKFPNVYVCTGPLYLPRVEEDGFMYVKYRVLGNNHVAVPTHFFKVILMEAADQTFEMEAYVLPNQVISDETPLSTFWVPPESIERAAGLLFFDRLQRTTLKLINGKKQS